MRSSGREISWRLATCIARRSTSPPCWPAKGSPSRRSMTAFGWSASYTMISATSTWSRKPCKLTLGRYPAVELGVARDRAKAALEEVDKGNNPALRKRATRLALVWGRGAADAEVADIKAEDLTRESPVGDVWKGYLKVHLIPEATGSSVARFRGIFEKRILPKWRARPIAGMVKADALTVIDAALLRGQ